MDDGLCDCSSAAGLESGDHSETFEASPSGEFQPEPEAAAAQDEAYPWDDEMEVGEAVDESRVITLFDAADEEAEQAERAERAVSIGHSRAGSSGDAAELPVVYRLEESGAEASSALNKAERSCASRETAIQHPSHKNPDDQ